MKADILVSIYKPNPDFLLKQLKSLDNQDYENFSVIIWNDDPESKIEETQFNSIFKKHKFTYYKSQENLGYAKAFEHLISLSSADYIAFCDQDDIWLPDKMSKCIHELQVQEAVFVTTDRAIIDENDRVIIPSNRKQQPSVSNQWNSGDHITRFALFSTLAIGMNIVMKRNVARELLPLPDDTAHDKWMTAGASIKGKVLFIDSVLVQYRRHGTNVSGMFADIHSKKDYYEKRVLYTDYLCKQFLHRFSQETDRETINEITAFITARKKRNIRRIYKLRYLAPTIAWFEIALKFCPDTLFRLYIRRFHSS